MLSDPLILLFLLLPIAALSGWVLGRREKKRAPGLQGQEIPLDYIKGLNFLLNEQPDKAIDVFVQMLEVNSDTAETHLALGSLFRRRGEVDRAIRLHQNLIARPTLSSEQRIQAVYALGQDYMRAGLLDRAETLFSELVETGPDSTNALVQLIDIYQQEKDWDKAINIARKLAYRSGRSQDDVIAQYYCELAKQHLKKNEMQKALQQITRALSTDPNCARASLLEGEIEYQQSNIKAAIRAYRRVEEQDAAFIPETLEPLIRCARDTNKIDSLIEYLRDIIERHGGISSMLALSELLKETEGELVSADFISTSLQSRPSVRGMDRLIELNLEYAKESVREKLFVLKNVTTQLLVNKPIYKCEICGFNGKTLHWQCPGCKGWNTIKPIQGVEGE